MKKFTALVAMFFMAGVIYVPISGSAQTTEHTTLCLIELSQVNTEHCKQIQQETADYCAWAAECFTEQELKASICWCICTSDNKNENSAYYESQCTPK